MQIPRLSQNVFSQLNWAMSSLGMPHPGGRIMTCGMSFLQRVARGANVRLWMQPDRHGEFSAESFDFSRPYQWAMIRQIEIFQENANNVLDRLDVENLWECFKNFSSMRAGGLRIVIIAAGHYDKQCSEGKVEAFDKGFRAKLRRMDHTLWLEEFNRNSREILKYQTVKIDDFLPHVYSSMSAENILGRKHAAYYQRAATFMERVRRIPPRHRSVDYDVTVGLKTPKAAQNNNLIYEMPADRRYEAFMPFLRSLFRPLGASAMPAVMHMRSFGDHVRGKPLLIRKPHPALKIAKA